MNQSRAKELAVAQKALADLKARRPELFAQIARTRTSKENS